MQSVIIKPNIDQTLTDVLKMQAYSKVGVLVDSNTENLCYPLIKNNLPDHEVIRVEAGEKFKTIETCQRIW
ncbi:MAG TPA: 3-dehydroquinate synthase, partial [Cyclobacteriaceae bacterium]